MKPNTVRDIMGRLVVRELLADHPSRETEVMTKLSRWQLRKIKPSTLIEISGERWGCVYSVPFGFPWLSACVYLDTGWPIHRDHITRIGENALDSASCQAAEEERRRRCPTT